MFIGPKIHSNIWNISVEPKQSSNYLINTFTEILYIYIFYDNYQVYNKKIKACICSVFYTFVSNGSNL